MQDKKTEVSKNNRNRNNINNKDDDDETLESQYLCKHDDNDDAEREVNC